jgi:Zn-dependent protease with chaperone function
MMPAISMPGSATAIRPRRSMVLFAVLAMVMVIVSYILILLLAGACVYLPYLLVSRSESGSSQVLLLFLFGIAVAGAMLWSLVPRPDRFSAPGPLLQPAEHPRLFRELEQIAGALGERLPSEVYLIGDVNAWVADRGGFMGIGSRRVMGLGLPLLAILNVSQFRAVLAHEFGHYYGGDTRLGPWVYKTKLAIVRTFQNIGSVGKLARYALLALMYAAVTYILKGYFILFLRAMQFVSRKQEYRADELASLVAGAQPLIEGLRTIHGAAPAWPAYWQTEMGPVLGYGGMPGIGEGFARFVSSPEVSQKIEEALSQELREARTDPYDTHPPLAHRIAALQQAQEKVPAYDAQPAASLLDDIESTELHYIQAMNPQLSTNSLQRVTWEDVGAQVTIPTWRKFVGNNAGLLKGLTVLSIPLVTKRIGDLGAKIPDPKGMLLTPEQRTGRASQLLAAAFGLAMVDDGWQLHDLPGVFYFSRDEQRFEPFLAVQQLVSGKISLDEWVDLCQQNGIGDLSLVGAPAIEATTQSS